MSKGREYVLVFMGNTDTAMKLHIASYTGNGARVTIEAPGWDGGEPFEPVTVIVNRQRTETVIIPNRLQMKGTEKNTKAIVVSAILADIVVYALSNNSYSCGGYLVHPVDSLGTEYFAMNWWPIIPRTGHFSQVAVTTLETENLVTFTFPPYRGISIVYNGHEYTSDEQLIIRLERYQVMQIQDQDFHDLSGTRIQSLKPIAVFSGNALTTIGARNSVDMTVEQLPKVDIWGKSFVIVPTPNRRSGDSIKFVSLYEQTVVTLSSGNVFRLKGRGDHNIAEVPSNVITTVRSDKPILLAQFVRGDGHVNRGESEDDGQPSMMIVPPIQQYLESYRFVVPPDFPESYLLLVANRSIIGELSFDGNPISPLGWNPMPGDRYIMMNRMSLTIGIHDVIHTKETHTFGAYVYGSRHDVCSYMYPAGQCMDAIVVSYFLL